MMFQNSMESFSCCTKLKKQNKYNAFSTNAKLEYFLNGKTAFTNEINDHLQRFGFNLMHYFFDNASFLGR